MGQPLPELHHQDFSSSLTTTRRHQGFRREIQYTHLDESSRLSSHLGLLNHASHTKIEISRWIDCVLSVLTHSLAILEK